MEKHARPHLHRLLTEVMRHIYARETGEYTVVQYGSQDLEEAVEGSRLNDYTGLEVSPASVHSAMTGHKGVVMTLAEALFSLNYGEGRDTQVRLDGGEKESDTDLQELGEKILGGHEEVEEQEKDPIENRHIEEGEEVEEPEEDDAGYEGFT
ncbi:MAG: hypothetical protein MUP63_01240 [Candidatus Nanohaloarchaeota archaeon QJJ-7]|nr:hypothetical protein [Candidatus Nanohaloarchaeota archaeon QJJ-7]